MESSKEKKPVTASLGEYDEENDVNKPYNCLTGKEHFWVFDELEQEGKNGQ